MALEVRVKKRLGKIEDFERQKVASSIFKAAQRVGGKDQKLADELAGKIEILLKKIFQDRKIITTDEIGDAVEKVLIEEGHARTAKTFILYREGQRRSRKKLVKLKDISRLREFLRLTDKKTVFVTGVYDLLHIGHVRYLKKASLQGNILIVGLNSDESVKKLKNELRPILGEEIRAETLSYFEFIDYIVIYDEVDASGVIAQLKPDVYVCIEDNWDSKIEEKPEVKEVRKYGGRVVIFPRQHSGLSTTDIIKKISDEKKDGSVKLVASAWLVEEGKVLLVKQKNHRFWSPPGGFVEENETAKEACQREIKEEIGLDIECRQCLEPVMFWDKDTGEKILVLYYLAKREPNSKINIDNRYNKEEPGGVEDFQWVRFDEVENFSLAPSVLPGINKLKEKLNE